MCHTASFKIEMPPYVLCLYKAVVETGSTQSFLTQLCKKGYSLNWWIWACTWSSQTCRSCLYSVGETLYEHRFSTAFRCFRKEMCQKQGDKNTDRCQFYTNHRVKTQDTHFKTMSESDLKGKWLNRLSINTKYNI